MKQQMTNEEYLNQIETLTRRITYRREQLLRLRLEAESVSSRWRDLSGVSGGTCNTDASYVRILERIEAKEEELKGEEELLFRLREQVEQAIELLPSEDLRLMMLYRYLEGKNYVQIAGILHVSWKTAVRWRDEALELFCVPEDAIEIF